MTKAHVYKRDHINTDEIIPARYLNTDDERELAQHCMEDLDADFVKKVKAGDVIVAGEDFGCGSSREHAVWAIRGAGVQTVIAKSFARIFYRNAINCGFYLIESADAVEKIGNSDEIEVDYRAGLIKDMTRGIDMRFNPLPEFALEIIGDGGLLSHIKSRMTEEELMSDTRQRGLRCLQRFLRQRLPGCVAVSKFFQPNESWTGKETWWFDLPIKKIKENKDKDYYLLGARNDPKTDFVIMKVPNGFLIEKLQEFETGYNNMIRLHLAAYAENWLVDERGIGKVPFSEFEVK